MNNIWTLKYALPQNELTQQQLPIQHNNNDNETNQTNHVHHYNNYNIFPH